MIIEEVEDKIEDLLYHSAHEDMSLSVDYMSGWNDGIFAAMKVIADSKPLADVEPVRHGWWEHDIYLPRIICSECNCAISEIYEKAYKYCPFCGAKMDEVTE